MPVQLPLPLWWEEHEFLDLFTWIVPPITYNKGWADDTSMRWYVKLREQEGRYGISSTRQRVKSSAEGTNDCAELMDNWDDRYDA